ncbi:MAG: F0F1 ATP synthase subunit B [Tepidisphaeraceae bacterium]
MIKRALTVLSLTAAIFLTAPAGALAADPSHNVTHAAEAARDKAHAGALKAQADIIHETQHGADKSPLPDPTSADTWYQALWVVIIFIVLLAILYPTAWKNVLAGLKKREERIRKDIADAETARVRAEATLKEYNNKLATAENQMRDILSRATTEGEAIATKIRMQAQQESEEIKERANRDIESVKNAALREVYEQTATLATSVAEKILRRNLNADDQRELVRSSLEQLQTIKA